MCLPISPYKIEREWICAGLRCAVVQAREQGHRCGYVRLPPGHFDYGKDYGDIDVDVHGGLTFARMEDCVEGDGRGYWLGFDCHHSNDQGTNPRVPLDYQWQSELSRRAHDIMNSYSLGGHYWTQAEVEAEAEHLALQLSEHHHETVV